MAEVQVQAAMAAWRPYQDINPKIPLLISAIDDGQVRVLITAGTGGSHNGAVRGSLFVSQNVLNQNDDFAVAVVIFAEFQHDPGSGAVLDEVDAQAEWVQIREAIRRRNPQAITPYINGLVHGGRQ